MPIYEYRCDACETRFERLVRAFGETVFCPRCDGDRVERLFSSFALAASPGSGPPRATGAGCCGGGCGCAH